MDDGSGDGISRAGTAPTVERGKAAAVAVEAGGCSPLVLRPAEHSFEDVSLATDLPMMLDLDFAVDHRRIVTLDDP